MTALFQVLSLFLLMLCGLGAVRFRLLDDRGLKGLNTLVLNFAQPAMIVFNLQRSADPQLIRDLIWVFVLTCLTIGLAGAISFALFLREPAQRRSVLTNLAMVSNCGYMGYPVIMAALGDDKLIYAVVFVAAFNLMAWTLGAFFYGGRKATQPQRLLRNPSLLAIALGPTPFFTGRRLPDFLNDALDMMGGVTTPVAMFVIGARLISLRPAHLKDMKLLLVCLLRLIVFPAAILLLFLTPLPDMVVKSIFVCTAMPCAALTAMQSEVFDCDRELASRGVALSTALSMATVPLMLLFVTA